MKTYSFLPQKRLHGFTLVEVLIVLVILGILALMVLGKYTPTVNKAKATEAKLQLNLLRTLEQSYYYEHSGYSKELNDVGFAQEKLVTENGHANYRIEVTNATSTTFTARAVAVKDFNGDGKYDTWEINQDGDLKQVNTN